MVPADTSAASTGRSYVSELRRQQAAHTRERVVDAAAQLFAEKGYAATTMPAIARRARVSTETVQNHGPKIELLRAAIAAVSFGAPPGGDVVETERGRRMLAAASPLEAAQVGAAVLAAVNGSAHGVYMAFSEASRSDPALATELRTLTGQIAAQTAELALAWRDRGWLRTDLSLEELVSRACVVGSVEMWDRYVRVEGHTPAAYQELLAGLLVDLWMTPTSLTPTSLTGVPGDDSVIADESEDT